VAEQAVPAILRVRFVSCEILSAIAGALKQDFCSQTGVRELSIMAHHFFKLNPVKFLCSLPLIFKTLKDFPHALAANCPVEKLIRTGCHKYIATHHQSLFALYLRQSYYI